MLKPFRVLTEGDISTISLISKCRNGPYKPIYKEELPKILYGNSPRQVLGSTWFDKYTQGLSSVKVCQGCGRPLSGSGERHELYSLNSISLEGKLEYLIKLEGVMKVCSSCHKVIHTGFSTRLGMRYGSIPVEAPTSKALLTGPWSKCKFLMVLY